MTSGLQPGDLVIVAGRPSMGKAQPLHAPVRTLTGWAPIGSLRVGDELASIDGRPSVVTGVYEQGVRPVYRLRFCDGRSALACAEHLWRVRRGDSGPARILETRELLARMRADPRAPAFTIDRPDGRFGGRDPLPTPAHAMGLALRAACAESAGSRRDPMAVGGWAGGVDARPAADPDPDSDLAVRAATGLRVPRAYLDAGRQDRADLLGAWLGPLVGPSGDGERPRWRLPTRGLAEDATELVRSLGGWCRAQPQDDDTVELTLALPSLPALWPALRAGEVPRPALVSIEPAGVAPTRCISVSHPSRLYLTSDYVVTHNTAFSLNIGEHVAVDQGLPVAVFSMEMGATQLALRMVCSVGRLDQQRLRTGRLVDDDWPRLTNAIQKMQDAQLFIDETPALNALELRARARRLSRQCGQLGLIIIDYLQLMSSASAGENRATEISEISRSLKALAKELNCPVIALSQLNRSLEQRPNKRPVMSDLRESGAIEQDADVILFIYRDEVYNPDSPDKGTAEIIIGKQRNGPIGTVRLTFVGQYTKFENYSSGAV